MRYLLATLLLLVGCDGSDNPAEQDQPQPTIVIGDSIMARWDFPSGIVNQAVPGEITRSMRDRFEFDVMAHRPAVVIIEGGVNDIVGQPNPNPRFVEEMANTAAAAGAKVVLVSMLPAVLPSWCLPVEDWNAELKAIAAAHGYTYVDLSVLLENADGSIRTELYYADLVHPTAEAYGIMWPVLQKALH